MPCHNLNVAGSINLGLDVYGVGKPVSDSEVTHDQRAVQMVDVESTARTSSHAFTKDW